MAYIRKKTKENHKKGDGRAPKYDPLMLTWKICRLVGIAPVRFEERGPVVSTFWTVYSCILMCIMHTCYIYATVRDMSLDKVHSVRVRTPSAAYAWLAELVIVLTTNTIAVLGGKERMKECIHYLHVIEKVTMKLEGGSNKYIGVQYYVVTAVYIFSIFLLQLGDLFTFVEEVIYGDKDLTVVALLVTFVVQATVLPLLEVQFMLIALYAQLPLEQVNRTLKDILNITELQKTPISVLMTNKNICIDMNMLHERTSSRFKSNSDESNRVIAEKIRRLVIFFGATCDVINGLSKTYGSILLCTIVSIVMHNVVTPYYFFLHLSKLYLLCLCPTGSGNVGGHFIIQLFFYCFYAIYIAMVVEPGYKTEKQIECTQILASRLLRHTSSPLDPIAGELDLLVKQIILNKPSYSPLRTCVLSRPFILTFISGATTYLVIVIQFQRLDISNDW